MRTAASYEWCERVRRRRDGRGGDSGRRLPAVVQLLTLAPMDGLEDRGLDHLVREQYDLSLIACDAPSAAVRPNPQSVASARLDSV
ncbi:hypothetical protein [Haloarcula pellucida]|uniref:hypothetical protein n=1 Tax=Haloarcula pellucida TaxID=1427151 RepID=UPI00166670C6|nr:hypothetical protein [Halomicroarcula pellucida]MBX0348647.1 hypothetical protein [Halomicroarcula pellucida]